jgi:broad specificity phosphatase PhoE
MTEVSRPARDPKIPETTPSVIMIVRHGEKPTSGKPHGVDLNGDHDHNSLTVVGWVRAGGLVELFAPVYGEPAPGLRRPDLIYASVSEGGRSKRSIQTVSPLASRLGVDIDCSFAHGEEQKLAKHLRTGTGTGNILVSWHHATIHTIVEHLGPVAPQPPRKWPSSRYDVVWTFTRSGDGWVFDQVVELLAPDDLPEPISTARSSSHQTDEFRS